MTIAELLARKAATAGTRAATLEKPAPVSPLIVRAGGVEPEPEAPRQTVEPERRSLGGPKGEMVPVTPAHATPEEAAWHLAAQGLEGELCAVRHPDDPETAWIALRHPSNRALPMLLLHPLPWVLYDEAVPGTVRPEDEPY
jgi:hypothetical protein